MASSGSSNGTVSKSSGRVGGPPNRSISRSRESGADEALTVVGIGQGESRLEVVLPDVFALIEFEAFSGGLEIVDGAAVVSTMTVPEKAAGRAAASQISAGDSFRKVKLWDQPDSLVTVAFQMALPFELGSAMPCSCKTLNTAIFLSGMPSTPWESR